MLLLTRRPGLRDKPTAPGEVAPCAQAGIAGRKFKNALTTYKLLIYNGLLSENRCFGPGPGIRLRSLPCLELKLTRKILNVAREPQVPTYAPNTTSGLIYLVWNIVKECQDAILRRARSRRSQVQFQSPTRDSRAPRLSGPPQNYGRARIG
jgi:hypothetical protein